MSTQDIVQKLWNLCNVLRDDGITYHQYVTELTYILFLKMAKETGAETEIPEEYRWDSLSNKSGLELKKHYYTLLTKLGEESVGRVAQIYANASSSIEEPKTLKKLSRKLIDLIGTKQRKKALAICMKACLKRTQAKRSQEQGSILRPEF